MKNEIPPRNKEMEDSKTVEVWTTDSVSQRPEKKTIGIKGRAKLLVYLNHFLIGWDDNMWWFALGLFLVEITPQSVRFTATNGLAGGCAVLLFGTLIGDWIDRTSRLTVARVSVLVQNSALMLCSMLIFFVLKYKSAIADVIANEGLLRMCYALIILLAIVSNLTNMARKTAIERDWIVEICEQDNEMLASFSATMRRISLLTMVICPIVTGQILRRTSSPIGALAIVGWNFLTIFLEYFLLLEIYNRVPQLQKKKGAGDQDLGIGGGLMPGVSEAVEFSNLLNTDEQNDRQKQTSSENAFGNGKPNRKYKNSSSLQQDFSDDYNFSKETPKSGNIYTHDVSKTEVKRGLLCRSFLSSFIALYKGWRIYMSYDVAFAGLALASLYLTVLAFDGVTIGYAYTQGISADWIGGLVGLAAFTGIIGTIIYPILRRKVGLQRTGLYALAAEITSLSVCVISVWCPGSSFDPFYFSRPDVVSQACNNSLMTNMTLLNDTTISPSFNHNRNESLLQYFNNNTDVNMSSAISPAFGVDSFNGSAIAADCDGPTPEVTSRVSIVLLMTGIIGARIGLWLSDLTITQLFLETVSVTDRGIVGGFQNSINMFMDLIKFVLVIVLPVPPVFGYLVMISFCFICLGWVLFAIYVYRDRGYLLPCNKRKETQSD